MPDLRGRFVKCRSGSGSIGEIEESSLPNIRGDGLFFSTEITSMETLWGALKSLKWEDKHITPEDGTYYENGDGGWGPNQGFQLDASAYNEVYKDETTEVTPPNMSLNYIIKT